MLHRKMMFLSSVLAGLALACGPGDNNENTGGAGGSGGAGGGGVGGGTTPDPAGPKDPDAALKAAIFIGSCLPDDGVQRYLNRFYMERGGLAGEASVTDFTQCFVDKVNGCEAVEECIGAKVDLSGPCMTSCQGDVIKGCDDQLAYHQDCSVLGLVCSETERNCVDPSAPAPASCDSATYKDACVDGAPTVCGDDKVLVGQKCADFGLVCKDSPFGGVGCLGGGAACQPTVTGTFDVRYDEGLACDGTALRACLNGGEQAVECDSLGKGFTCQTAGSTYFCGLSNACNPTLGNKATCEGDSIVTCNAGRVEKIDCKSLGFTGCNATWGTCSPSIYDQAPDPGPDPGP